ncbi:MAG: bifunctional oligoribonuclease/PAP phosphatase NrnA [Clostridiales bacterium]|nr:bifunctional oligoribonuclease/PAP phosphatase NrnA [Clostridiales bacterium]
MKVNPAEAVQLLNEHDNILIIAHAHPDGDTLGSSYALCRVLLSRGKRAAVICEDNIPKMFSFMAAGLSELDFEPEFIVAADVAGTKLMGSHVMERYGDGVDLCIDHHFTNELYAKNTLLDDTAAACAEIMLRLFKEMRTDISPVVAECLYAGISTDTGCFRYPNLTSGTLRAAAELIDLGADFARINKDCFETKSKSFVALEKMALNNIETYFGGLCAFITITAEMLRECGSSAEEFDRIAALPRQIEDVLVGVTIREQSNGTFKASVRTNPPMNAADICKRMNGGGHIGAAGCTLTGTAEDVRNTILRNVEDALKGEKKL